MIQWKNFSLKLFTKHGDKNYDDERRLNSDRWYLQCKIKLDKNDSCYICDIFP